LNRMWGVSQGFSGMVGGGIFDFFVILVTYGGEVGWLDSNRTRIPHSKSETWKWLLLCSYRAYWINVHYIPTYAQISTVHLS
jgi:hypothetical protein